MNCQEVMELMQRQLDEDLDAQEEEILDAHLKHCAECAEMQMRLKLLSSELTSLPKVIPAYSLVDAILPRLVEIDGQAAGSGQDDTYSSSLIEPASTQPRGIPWARRSRSPISWKVAGGVIAAGLIIGFFIFQPNNPLSNQADGLLQPRKNSDAKSAATSVGAQEKNKDTAGSAEQHKPTNPSSGDMKKDSNYGNSGDLKTETKGTTADPAAKNSEHSQKTTVPSPNEPKADKPITHSGAAAKGGTNNSNSEVPSVSPDTSEQPQISSPELSPEPSAYPTMEAPTVESLKRKSEQKGFAPDSTSAPEQEPVETSSADTNKGMSALKSIGPIMPEETSESLDGKYVAAIEQHHVLIKVSDSGEIVFTSKKIWSESDKVTLQKWSEDHKLTYQVVNDMGTQTFQIDMSNQSETVLK
jgi:hypothetical protein